MASKPVDHSVNERRLRPVYDWLDAGNNKKALQEADKVLKKQPTLYCAKALKSLALIRLGKVDEAETLLRELQSDEPYDDATLQAMTICFREIHHPELTCEVYESALKKDPQNEELLSHLFMAYVRIGDYKKQQQTAMILYKTKPKNPYYFWAVMSILMQAHSVNSNVCLTVTLPLAERMIKKFVADNKIEAEAEVQLYLMILEKEGKFKEALEVLSGPLSEKLTLSTVELKTGEYLRHLKQWDQMLDFYGNLLLKNPDQWEYYVNYLEAMFKVSSSDESVVLKAKGLISELFVQEEMKTKDKLRGPYLAKIYFWQELKVHQLDAALILGDIRPLFEIFIDVFGDKPCTFHDLKPFIHNLSESDVEMFLEHVKNSTRLEERESPTNVKQLYRHLLYHQLTRRLGRHDSLSCEEKLQLAEQLWLHYKNTSSLSEGLLTTDFKPNDGYALLAAHLYLDVWNNDSRILCRCLTLLKTVRINSPANYHVKLLLMRTYTTAGYGRAALQSFETLDIKYIQLDSLGHLLTRPLISMGLPQSAAPVLASTLRFYNSHAKETSECLISAYKFGSFSKIPEFTQFCQRLDNSAHFAAITVERMLLDLLTESSSHTKLVQVAMGMFADLDKNQPEWESLVDNRDLGIFISWDPTSRLLSNDLIKETFISEVRFARLRNRLLHCIIAGVSLSPSWMGEISQSTSNNKSSNGELNTMSTSSLLQQFLSELQSLSSEFEKQNTVDCAQFPLQCPPPPRLYTYMEDRCLDPIIILFRYLTDLTKIINKDTVKEYEKALNHVLSGAQRSTVIHSVWKNYIQLEHIYNALETLGLCALLLSIVHAILKGNNSVAKKKKKRDQKDPAFDSMAEQYESLINATLVSMQSMENLLNDLDLKQSLEQLEVESSEILDEIRKTLNQSRSTEMKTLLKDKWKLLESCAL